MQRETVIKGLVSRDRVGTEADKEKFFKSFEKFPVFQREFKVTFIVTIFMFV